MYDLIENIVKQDILIENIVFEKATTDDIDEIINLYAERMEWFKKME